MKTPALSKNASGKRCALAGSIIAEIAVLEDQLNSKLHVESFTGPNARRAVPVANRIAHIAESTSRSAVTLSIRRACGAHGSGASSQVDSVKKVEHFGAKLD